MANQPKQPTYKMGEAERPLPKKVWHSTLHLLFEGKWGYMCLCCRGEHGATRAGHSREHQQHCVQAIRWVLVMWNASVAVGVRIHLGVESTVRSKGMH